jgi:hypothetical protein
MDNIRMHKKYWIEKFNGRRPVRRPRLRWEDKVRRNSSLLLTRRG